MSDPMFDDTVRRFVDAQLTHPERTYLLQTTGPLWRALQGSDAAARTRAVEQALIEAVKWARS